MKKILVIFALALVSIGSLTVFAKAKLDQREPASAVNSSFEFKEKSVEGGTVVCGVASAPGYNSSHPSSFSAAVSTSCVFVPGR